jgi:hypothetical protein
MKNVFKRIGNIVIIPIFISCLFFSACKGSLKADPETDFKAKPVDGGKGVEITEYLGSKFEVVIPSKIQKLPVVSIGKDAFREKNLIKVTIPNSVKEIGEGAFAGNQLTSITIPNSVKEIGEGAFFDNQLTSITIPNSVTKIGGDAFTNNQLTSVTIGANLKFNSPFITWTLIGYEDLSKGFEGTYNNGGKLAGTYTRPNTESQTWTKK